jgi:hypothetical protein
MRSQLRGLAGGLLVLGLFAAAGPARVAAQAKKDPAKKDPVKVDASDNKVGISTSDGLSLNAYWFQGNALDKNPPDAVLMFPPPGSKVTDAWIGLAKAMSEKNFSVLLMDWRGCGMNAAGAAGSRVIADKELFWKEPYNMYCLKPIMKTVDDQGLDFQKIRSKTDRTYRYIDFLYNDMLAARFYLDRQNDNGKCNTNRIWMVTEKDGGDIALGFMASEFLRNTIYNPKQTSPLEFTQVKPAGKDYVGLTCLSWGGTGPFTATANAVWSNSARNVPANTQRDMRDQFDHRLAMVMVYGKKEGAGGSRSGFSKAGAGGNEDELKKNYKYLREVDNSKLNKAVSGIDLIDPMDSFGAQKTIVDSMVGISKVLPGGKDKTDREANKMIIIPRFPAEQLGRR